MENELIFKYHKVNLNLQIKQSNLSKLQRSSTNSNFKINRYASQSDAHLVQQHNSKSMPNFKDLDYKLYFRNCNNCKKLYELYSRDSASHHLQMAHVNNLKNNFKSNNKFNFCSGECYIYNMNHRSSSERWSRVVK